MSTLFLVLQFIFAVVLTIAVLLQKSSSIGLGAYSGSNESLFGAKGPAGFLAKFTFFVGFLFILNTLALGYTYNQSLRNSVVQSKEFKSLVPEASKENTQNTPSAPVTLDINNSIIDINNSAIDTNNSASDTNITKD